MRFLRLVIESFQAIQRAEVDFGPGLNVLYGPNDLGKSTLAAAIRAALLVPPTSAEAAQFSSWYVDATPRVSLTFVDDAGHFWKVSKGFGEGTNTGAELSHSKDGTSFALDCKARQVEERVRGLLAWGVPAPGGKGGPRGIPSTFLANALLATQTDVDAILGASLAGDPDASGKLRLASALATLAQDPLFKRVLDEAQREVDQCFTRTGQRSRAQTSRFTEAANVIKGLQKEREALERQVGESSAIAERVNALRERRALALVRVDETAAALAATGQRRTRALARVEAEERLEAAKVTLADIDAFADRVRAVEVDVEELSRKAKAREDDMGRAVGECDASNAAVTTAEEAHRQATSEDGVRQRELRRAQLAERASTIGAKKQETLSRKVSVDSALKVRLEAGAARDAAVVARKDLDKLSRELLASREGVTALEQQAELARAILAYGRWRAASSAAEDAAKAKSAAADARAVADQREADAVAIDGRATEADDELVRRQAILPSEDLVRALAQLERDLEVAEAALGGGLSVAVRPRSAIALHALIDLKEAVGEPSLTAERVLDAERSLRLSIGDLVEIEVTAGATDKRRAVETLRARARMEIVPVLEHAGLDSLSDVARHLAAISKDRAATAVLRQEAAKSRSDAQALRERAVVYDEQATRLGMNADDLAARKAAIGATQVEVLDVHLRKLGKAWESQADTLLTKKTSELRVAQAGITTREQAVKVAEYRASDADLRAAAATAACEAALAALESSDPDALMLSLEDGLASLQLQDAEVHGALDALGAEASVAVEKAKRALDEARQRAQAAKGTHGHAAAALDVARAAVNGRIGELGALRAQLQARDRAGASAVLEQRRAELTAMPIEPGATDADIAAAERAVAEANRELEEAKEELHKSEGALSKVGGAAIREEVDRVQEALNVAGVRERALEIDADAWKLLRDTLRDVENEEGAHLGRALAGPVATKFIELTGGRYRDLRLDAALKTEAVQVAGGSGDADVLRALSVGTRGQLATLIRLTIADQLKSAIVLDDHLVHTDPKRLTWFRDMLTKTAVNTQVIVITCRPQDYLSPSELTDGAPIRDLAGGTMRAIDAGRVVKRYASAPSRPPPDAEAGIKVRA